MKRLISLALISMAVSAVQAQTESDSTAVQIPESRNVWRSALTDSLWSDSITAVMPGRLFPVTPSVLYWTDPYAFSGAAPWYLHDGLNFQLSTSVTVGLGRDRFPGALFSTQASAAYVFPVTSRFRLIGGVYVDTQHWNGWHDRSFGLSGMAAYQLTEKVTLGAYASKRILPFSHIPAPFRTWGLYDYDHRFGGLIHVKCNDAFSFSISVEEAK